MRWFQSCLAVLLLLAIGCGGGNGGSGGSGIGGEIDATNYTIPAGKVLRATSDLVIHTTDTLTIDGKLEFEPGVSVALISDGAIQMTGSIEPTGSRAASSRGSGSGGSQIVFSAGSDSTIASTKGGEGESIMVSASSGGVNITLGRLEGGQGAQGLSLTQPGGPGGSVEIGSNLAQQTALAKGAKAAFEPFGITLKGDIVGGIGGPGWDDQTGKRSGKDIEAHAGDGGQGGSIHFNAKNLTSGVYSFRAGNGGFGGDCAPATGYLTAKDGSTAHEKGGFFKATTGNGGKGGDLVFVSGQLPEAKDSAGHGGTPGGSKGGAGNGGPNGGEGGDASVQVGLKGQDGAGQVGTSTLPNLALIVMVGGNGHDAGDKDTQGGNGGGVGITDGLGEKADCQVTFLNTLSGGAGFSSACQTGTNPPGTKGGDGGTAEIHGAPILENTASGNGGKGGSGTPPSTGGAAGKTDGGVLIGKAGGDGSNCGGTGGTTVTDYNPKHGVAGDSFEISGTHLGGTNAIVTIGGKHATIQFGDDLSIQVTVPSGLSAGTYNLFVNGVLAGSFTIDP